MQIIGTLKIENLCYELYREDNKFFKRLNVTDTEILIDISEIKSALLNVSGKISYYIEDLCDKEELYICTYSNKEDMVKISINGYGKTPEEALDNAEKNVSELLDKCGSLK